MDVKKLPDYYFLELIKHKHKIKRLFFVTNTASIEALSTLIEKLKLLEEGKFTVIIYDKRIVLVPDKGSDKIVLKIPNANIVNKIENKSINKRLILLFNKLSSQDITTELYLRTFEKKKISEMIREITSAIRISPRITTLLADNDEDYIIFSIKRIDNFIKIESPYKIIVFTEDANIKKVIEEASNPNAFLVVANKDTTLTLNISNGVIENTDFRFDFSPNKALILVSDKKVIYVLNEPLTKEKLVVTINREVIEEVQPLFNENVLTEIIDYLLLLYSLIKRQPLSTNIGEFPELMIVFNSIPNFFTTYREYRIIQKCLEDYWRKKIKIVDVGLKNKPKYLITYSKLI